MERAFADVEPLFRVDLLLPTARFVFSIRSNDVDVLPEHSSAEAFEQYVRRRREEPVTGMLTFPNSLLVSGSPAFVVDPGLRAQNQPLLKALEQRRLGPSDLAFAALTHAHDDHAAALADLPVPVVLHERETRTSCWRMLAPALEGRELRLLQGSGGELVPGVRWALTAGHSPGSVSYAVDTAQGVVALCGDLIGPSRRPFDEMDPPDGPHAEELLASWRIVRSWHPVSIVAGHLQPFRP